MAKKKTRTGRNTEYERTKLFQEDLKRGPKAKKVSDEIPRTPRRKGESLAVYNARWKSETANATEKSVAGLSETGGTRKKRGRPTASGVADALGKVFPKKTKAVEPKVPKKRKAAKPKADGDGHSADMRAIAKRSEKLRIKYEEAKTVAREALQAWNAARDQLVREALDDTPTLFNQSDPGGVVGALKKPKPAGSL